MLVQRVSANYSHGMRLMRLWAHSPKGARSPEQPQPFSPAETLSLP